MHQNIQFQVQEDWIDTLLQTVGICKISNIVPKRKRSLKVSEERSEKEI